ncbi:hypothetical protein TNCV_1271451 [Trichonephila clavipes]|nr:hypothetical protein TNCV_1271451 [Trichonephila clavipes]
MAYDVPSIHGHWTLRCMSISPNQVVFFNLKKETLRARKDNEERKGQTFYETVYGASKHVSRKMMPSEEKVWRKQQNLLGMREIAPASPCDGKRIGKNMLRFRGGSCTVEYCGFAFKFVRHKLSTLKLKRSKRTNNAHYFICTAVGSLVVRASDSRPGGLGSMLPNTLRVHTEYVVVKPVGRKSCGPSHERRGLENISLTFNFMQKLWRAR